MYALRLAHWIFKDLLRENAYFFDEDFEIASACLIHKSIASRQTIRKISKTLFFKGTIDEIGR